MNAPPSRDLYEQVALAEEVDGGVEAIEPAHTIPFEAWCIVAVITIAALNVLRLVLN